MRRAWVFILAIACSGCTVTEPVAVINQFGQTLRGTATTRLAHATFSVSDGFLTCSGSYMNLDLSPTISIPVTCSDGRKAIAIATLNNGGTSGSGIVRFSDGTQGTFIFGPGAAKI
jgi:hypothetical protein